ncbi:MAG TPA: hypothetical protein ENF38_00285 [Candidatus Aenigmarchaeota archaeon]|nr:hypothetical protein [Candidatus Aenigmarchaeota archaeon]
MVRERNSLSFKSSKVLKIILEHWPVNPLEVARLLGERGDEKKLSAKYLYHFRKLARKDLIRMKKVGNTYVAWPLEIEKLRVIYELIRGV